MAADRSEFTRQIILVLLFLVVIIGIIYLARQMRSVEEILAYQPPTGDPDVAVTEIGEGRVVYVPVYSHIYQDAGEAFLLTITLSVRNTDPRHPIVVKSVNYHNTAGAVIKKFLENPLRLKPMASTEFLVEEKDSAGGSGANFMVEWASTERINPPIVEAVMIGTKGDQSISFVSRGEHINLDRD